MVSLQGGGRLLEESLISCRFALDSVILTWSSAILKRSWTVRWKYLAILPSHLKQYIWAIPVKNAKVLHISDWQVTKWWTNIQKKSINLLPVCFNSLFDKVNHMELEYKIMNTKLIIDQFQKKNQKCYKLSKLQLCFRMSICQLHLCVYNMLPLQEVFRFGPNRLNWNMISVLLDQIYLCKFLAMNFFLVIHVNNPSGTFLKQHYPSRPA